MGLLDSLAGQALGALTSSGNDQQASMLDAITGLLNAQPGGLAGLIQRFDQQGLGAVASSWVGTGENLGISAEQIQAVLGNEQIRAFAERLGFSPDEAARQLAAVLPQVIDTLTPGGALPEGGVAGNLMGVLKGALGQG